MHSIDFTTLEKLKACEWPFYKLQIYHSIYPIPLSSIYQSFTTVLGLISNHSFADCMCKNLINSENHSKRQKCNHSKTRDTFFHTCVIVTVNVRQYISRKKLLTV